MGERLLVRVRRAIRVRHYSRRTEFLSNLATELGVSASTQNQALCALLFLYREVLGQRVGWLDGLVRAKRSTRLPVVLTPDEVRALLGDMDGVVRLVAGLLYGSGLRLMEALSLRIKDVDFARSEITVRAAKGSRDRVTMSSGPGTTASSTSVGSRTPASSGPGGRRGLGGITSRVCEESADCGTGVEVAVGFPSHPAVCGCKDGGAQASPFA